MDCTRWYATGSRWSRSSGHAFLFANRARTRLRILFWDGSGLWLATKGLERGRFRWPAAGEAEGRLRLSGEELALPVGGLVLAATRRRAWFRRAVRARDPNGAQKGKAFFAPIKHLRAIALMLPPPSQPDPKDTPEVAELKRQLCLAHLKIALLEEKLRLLRLRRYGAAAEKLSPQRLALPEEEPGFREAEVVAEAKREPLPEPAATLKPPARTQAERSHPGRQELPESLPRRVGVLACPPEEQRCPACGSGGVLIGYDTSEQLDVEPARYYVLVIKREKRACPHCAETGITSAPLPPGIVEKGLVSDRVVVDTVVAKYVEQLPLYRQSAKLAREVGLAIRRATLDGWVMRVGGVTHSRSRGDARGVTGCRLHPGG